MFPLPGHLVGEGGVNQIDDAKEEDQPGERLQPAKNQAALHFLIRNVRPDGIQTEIAAAGQNFLQTGFHTFRFFRVTDNAPGIIKVLDLGMKFPKQLLRREQSHRIQGKGPMSVACPPHRVKQAGYGDGHGLLTQRQLHSGPDIHLSEVLLIACG